MERKKKFQRKIIGGPEYINENCWLAKTLNYAPYKRCHYCELKFHKCLFLHYQIISLILILFFLPLSFFIEGRISEFVVISIFTLVIVYGYFFQKSTDKIIQANFAERKAKEALEELAEELEEKVDQQTNELKQAYNKIEHAYEIEKKAHQELKNLSEAKNQFILATQHHLRTPLTIMKGYASMLIEGDYGKLNKKAKEKLVFFSQSTQKLIDLVNEFLDISQFQVGKKILKIEKVDPQKLIKEIIEEFKIEAEKKNIYLRIKELNRISMIKADYAKLREAIYNIIDNGIKYTEKGGIIISLEMKNKKLKIIIKDTGIGIDKKEMNSLFKKTFERSKGAQKLYTLGRGIGLYISSSIIKAHNGKIWVESSGENFGSTFYIELPVE